jgi:hypothetical protein
MPVGRRSWTLDWNGLSEGPLRRTILGKGMGLEVESIDRNVVIGINPLAEAPLKLGNPTDKLVHSTHAT